LQRVGQRRRLIVIENECVSDAFTIESVSKRRRARVEPISLGREIAYRRPACSLLKRVGKRRCIIGAVPFVTEI
jgi:hypothetical protein